MNFKRKFLIGLLILLLLFTLSSFFLPESFLPGSACAISRTVPASLEVVQNQRNYLGFNTNKDSLNFGKVTPESAVKRSITVGYSLPAEVKVETDADFSSWLQIAPEQFELSANETKEVFFTVNVPEEALPGNYSGEVIFCFKQ